MCFIYLNIIEKKECPSLSALLYCRLETMKLLNKSVICYFHYIKSILNDDLSTPWFNWLPWTSTGSSYLRGFRWNQRNLEILKFYTSWVHWKNQCRSTVRNYALLGNEHEYQHSDTIVKNIFNPFYGTGVFLYFLKYIRKPEVAHVFGGHRRRPVPWMG